MKKNIIIFLICFIFISFLPINKIKAESSACETEIATAPTGNQYCMPENIFWSTDNVKNMWRRSIRTGNLGSEDMYYLEQYAISSKNSRVARLENDYKSYFQNYPTLLNDYWNYMRTGGLARNNSALFKYIMGQLDSDYNGGNSTPLWQSEIDSIQSSNNKNYYNNSTGTNNNIYNTGDTTYYSVYNDYTKQIYNTTNNSYYNVANYTYNYETNNYNYSYNYNITNNHYMIVQNTYNSTNIYNFNNGSENEYELYFRLPDGSNSYNLTEDNIRGLRTDFTVSNYDNIYDYPSLIGLYHFDNNYKNSAYGDQDLLNFSKYSSTYQDSANNFSQAVMYNGDLEYNVEDGQTFDQKMFVGVNNDFNLSIVDSTSISDYLKYNYGSLDTNNYNGQIIGTPLNKLIFRTRDNIDLSYFVLNMKVNINIPSNIYHKALFTYDYMINSTEYWYSFYVTRESITGSSNGNYCLYVYDSYNNTNTKLGVLATTTTFNRDYIINIVKNNNQIVFNFSFNNDSKQFIYNLRSSTSTYGVYMFNLQNSTSWSNSVLFNKLYYFDFVTNNYNTSVFSVKQKSTSYYGLYSTYDDSFVGYNNFVTSSQYTDMYNGFNFHIYKQFNNDYEIVNNNYLINNTTEEYQSNSEGNQLIYNGWNHILLNQNSSDVDLYVNGINMGSLENTTIDNVNFNVQQDGFVLLDEFRILNDNSNFTYNGIPNLPYDTNLIYLLPKNVETSNKILVKSNIPVNNWQIGGVRGSQANRGDVFIYVDDFGYMKSLQQYDGLDWVAVDGALYNQILGKWVSYNGFSIYTNNFDYQDIQDITIYSITDDFSFYQWLQQEINRIIKAIESISFTYENITNNTNNIDNLFPDDTNFWDFLISLIDSLMDNVSDIIDKLIEFLRWLFIPDSANIDLEIDSLKTNLGVLWLPVELFSSILNYIFNSNINNQDHVIRFSGYSYDGVVVIPSFEYNFDTLFANEPFYTMYQIYLTIIDVVCIMYVINLARKKYLSIIGG